VKATGRPRVTRAGSDDARRPSAKLDFLARRPAFARLAAASLCYIC